MNEEQYKNREIREMFDDSQRAVAALRGELLDSDWGILPKVLAQTTKHNGRLTRLERITWVVGTAITVLAVSGNSSVLAIFAKFFI